jgi:Tfp pilus assembly protein PilF
MTALKSIRLITLSVAVIANGCAQFPSVVNSNPSARSTVNADDRTLGVTRFGEDPDAFTAPTDPARRRANLLLTRARLAIADGQNDAAVKLLEGILEKEPDHAEASHLIAVLQTQSGDLETAESRFRTALAHDSRNPKLNCDYGYFCYLTDRWDDAEQYLRKAVTIDPELAEAHTNLGMLAARRGDPDAAEEHFLDAGCTEVQVMNNLALARFLEADFATAESMYRDLLKLDPENRAANDGLRMAGHMSAAMDSDRESSPVSLAVGTATVGAE